MNDNNPLISLKNVSISFGADLILDHVSLEVNRGDFLALIGPNGSGKTTLIKSILGLLRPDEGTARIMGKEIKDFKEWDRIGYVPQQATEMDPLFPASVREIVAMGLIPGRRFPRFFKPGDRKAVERALALVDMQGCGSRRIGALSGGQQQRVFIARALVSNPSILILDEPTAGVDASSQTRFYDMLGNLNRVDGITLILVTHDIGVITRYVHQVACLNQKLIFHGTHEEFCSSTQATSLFGPDSHLVCHRH
ncbi:high-affinity zinc uptake system ATP-binding protein ZnuC [bacterium BMS3Abin14]|nr:high-affinity zinc uptake system ATP-binding protein ZnuC [bacterium BMS3Abin14]